MNAPHNANAAYFAEYRQRQKDVKRTRELLSRMHARTGADERTRVQAERQLLNACTQLADSIETPLSTKK